MIIVSGLYHLVDASLTPEQRLEQLTKLAIEVNLM